MDEVLDDGFFSEIVPVRYTRLTNEGGVAPILCFDILDDSLEDLRELEGEDLSSIIDQVDLDGFEINDVLNLMVIMGEEGFVEAPDFYESDSYFAESGNLFMDEGDVNKSEFGVNYLTGQHGRFKYEGPEGRLWNFLSSMSMILPEEKVERHDRGRRARYTFYCTPGDLIRVYEELDEVLFPEFSEDYGLRSMVENHPLASLDHMAEELNADKIELSDEKKRIADNYSLDEIKRLYNG